MTTPTHRVAKFLPAGSVDYHVGDLVDASGWNNTTVLVSTDFLIPLTKAEIEELSQTVVETPVDETPDEVVVPITTAKKAKATAKK
jgi:hypothetical protein